MSMQFIGDDIGYMDVLCALNKEDCRFRCSFESKFVTSLEEDGYDEHLHTWSEEHVERINKGRKDGPSGLTCNACYGGIYVPSIDGYYTIHMTKHEDDFEVYIEYNKKVQDNISSILSSVTNKMAGE